MSLARRRLAALGVIVWAVLLAQPAAARLGRPRIFNGIAASNYPAVAAILTQLGPFPDDPYVSFCSGALIGCDTVLVAAHCVCEEDALDATSCLAAGIDDPDSIKVFFQHAGAFDVASITIHPNFEFEVGSDVAILKLAQPVTGIAPLPLNRVARPPFGTSATIVGFGITDDGLEDSGVKRYGALVTAACPNVIPNDTHVCWNVETPLGDPGADTSTCDGDSGGPLLIDTTAGPTVAGVTSGGAPTCHLGSMSWDTDVFHDLAFIDAQGGIGTNACSALPEVGSTHSRDYSSSGTLTNQVTTASFSFDLPAGVEVLRVALNGEDAESGFRPRPNDFDLFVRYAAPPTDDVADCDDVTFGVYGYCEIAAPRAGTWHVLIESASGHGEFQLTVSALGGQCGGDCDGNGSVTVDEILRGVNIALGLADVQDCSTFDSDASGSVTVDEIIRSVDHALTGCL